MPDVTGLITISPISIFGRRPQRRSTASLIHLSRTSLLVRTALRCIGYSSLRKNAKSLFGQAGLVCERDYTMQ